MSTLPERLRLARLNAGYSLEELASLSGIGRASLQRYETGVSDPTIEKIFDLSKHLNVTFSYLLGLESKEISDKDLEFFQCIFDKLNLDYTYSQTNDCYYVFYSGEVKQFGEHTIDDDYILEHLNLINKKFILYPKDLKRIRDEIISFGEFKLCSILKQFPPQSNKD